MAFNIPVWVCDTTLSNNLKKSILYLVLGLLFDSLWYLEEALLSYYR